MTAQSYRTNKGLAQAWQVDGYDEDGSRSLCKWAEKDSKWLAYMQAVSGHYLISLFQTPGESTLLSDGEFVIKDEHNEVYVCSEKIFNLLTVIESEESSCTKCEGVGWTMEPDPNDPSGQTPMQEQCDCQIPKNLKEKAEQLISELEDELCGFQQIKGICDATRALANALREMLDLEEKTTDFRTSGFGEGFVAGWNQVANRNLNLVVKKLEAEVEKLQKF